jgi:two-component system sensor histidine kinase RegB
MSDSSSAVRHVVAWLQPVRWATCLLLWAVTGVVWLFPSLDLSLRGVALLALSAALCRTVVLIGSQWWRSVRTSCIGLAWIADAALLTGLLDITGGPFNPFIVMYVAYAWAAAVVLSPAWGVRWARSHWPGSRGWSSITCRPVRSPITG